MLSFQLTVSEVQAEPLSHPWLHHRSSCDNEWLFSNAVPHALSTSRQVSSHLRSRKKLLMVVKDNGELTNLKAKKRMRRTVQESVVRHNSMTSSWYWLLQQNLWYRASCFSSWASNWYFLLAGMAPPSSQAKNSREPSFYSLCASVGSPQSFQSLKSRVGKLSVIHLVQGILGPSQCGSVRVEAYSPEGQLMLSALQHWRDDTRIGEAKSEKGGRPDG